MSSSKIADQLCQYFKDSKLNISGHVAFVITSRYIFEVFESQRGTHVHMSRFENNSGSLIQKMLVNSEQNIMGEIKKHVSEISA